MIILQKEEKNCDKSHCGGALVLRTGERPEKAGINVTKRLNGGRYCILRAGDRPLHVPIYNSEPEKREKSTFVKT